MCKRLMISWFASACLLFTVTAAAQEIVHALSGTVVKVDPQAKTILLNTDDGSEGQFNLDSSPTVSLNFSKEIRDQATPAGTFDKSNDQVVVFYYGNNSVRTAVAVLDLGAGPFVKSMGAIVKVNKHEHQVTIKDATGKSETFQMGPKTVADTMDGVVQGYRFDPQKGDNVSIVATRADGIETALFLHD